VRDLFGSRLFPAVLFVMVLFLFPAQSRGNSFRVQIPLPDGKTLPAYCYLPQHGVKYRLPAVVVAAGVGGTKILQFHEYCRLLAERNFVTVFIDPSNFPETLTPGPLSWDRGPGNLFAMLNQVVVGARLAFAPKWYMDSFKAVVDYLCMSPFADPTRIAISGFSQPANAALPYACMDQRIKAVIWNYGGWPWIFSYQAAQLPPVQIFHGEDDDVYDVKYARELAEELRTNMRYYEANIYPRQPHMFNIYYDPIKENRFMKPALLDAFERLVGFLNRVLACPQR
jgi:dienelactone hydrolase